MEILKRPYGFMRTVVVKEVLCNTNGNKTLKNLYLQAYR